MVLLAVLSAVSIPAYQEMRNQMRLSATIAVLESVRSAIAVYQSNEISAGRASGVVTGGRGYPAIGNVQGIDDSATLPKIMEDQTMPANPFAGLGLVGADHVTSAHRNDVAAPSTCSSPQIVNTGIDIAWCYDPTSGRFWANTQVMGEDTY